MGIVHAARHTCFALAAISDGHPETSPSQLAGTVPSRKKMHTMFKPNASAPHFHLPVN